MIKESIQQTVKLIEDINKIDPTAYQEDRIYLDGLVQHMKIVIKNLDRKIQSDLEEYPEHARSSLLTSTGR